MQAIILAAGMGKRLGDLTKDNTKCMIKVNGTYLIDRLLSQLDSLNLERIILVIGYQGEKLRTHIEKQSRNTPIEYTYNPVYNKTNNIYSLYLAKEELQKQDTLLIESDLIFEDTLFHKILNNPYPNLALVAKYEPWMDGTMVRLNTENDIIDFISKKRSATQILTITTKPSISINSVRSFSATVMCHFLKPTAKPWVITNITNRYYG